MLSLMMAVNTGKIYAELENKMYSNSDNLCLCRAMYGIENLLLNDGSVYWYDTFEKK